MIRGAILTTLIACLLVVSGSHVFGLDEKKQHDGLLKNMGKAKITLQQGLVNFLVRQLATPNQYDLG